MGLLTGVHRLRPNARRPLLSLLAAAALALATPSGANTAVQVAPGASAPELQVKAAYLYKFAGYVDWPTDAFASASAPIVLGVVGSDELVQAIEQQVAGRTSKGRGFAVRRLTAGEPVDGLHMLLVSEVDRAQLRAALDAARGKPVLTLSDARQATAQGCMIGLVTQAGRLRFEVALGPVAQSRLKLSALMLTAAQRVLEPRR